MPKYRQLHTKIVDSYDFSEMPDDFTRVFWLLLIVVVDSEGRGIDNPAWIRSRMFPLREDVMFDQIDGAMDWLDRRRMIRRYEINNRKYFDLPTFQTYQSGTDKEAKSVLPPAPELLPTNSVPAPELVRVNTIQYNAEAEADAPASAKPPPEAATPRPATALPTEMDLERIFTQVTGLMTIPATSRADDYERLHAIYNNKRGDSVEYLRPFWKAWTDRGYNKSNTAWLDWAITSEIPKQRSPNGAVNKVWTETE